MERKLTNKKETVVMRIDFFMTKGLERWVNSPNDWNYLWDVRVAMENRLKALKAEPLTGDVYIGILLNSECLLNRRYVNEIGELFNSIIKAMTNVFFTHEARIRDVSVKVSNGEYNLPDGDTDRPAIWVSVSPTVLVDADWTTHADFH